MKLLTFIKIGISIGLIGTLGLTGAACSGGQITNAASKGTGSGVAQNLILQADAVVGCAVGGPTPLHVCVESSQFQQGEIVAFRVKVYDPATGQTMDDKTLSSVVVTLSDGQIFQCKYAGHIAGATPTDYFWATSWTIPTDYPTGSFPYTVTAKSKDGRTGTFKDFNVSPSQLTVLAANN